MFIYIYNIFILYTCILVDKFPDTKNGRSSGKF